MPKFNITTGLPDLPAGNVDKDFNLVKPLYLGVNALAKAVSLVGGQVTFSQDELAEQNQISTLTLGNQRKIYVLAVGGALAYGKVLNLYPSGGKIAGRYADSTDNTKPAHAIVNAPLGIPDGQYGECILMEGPVTSIGGSTFGLYYYLSSNGDVQAGQPTAGGTIVQGMGFGLGTGGFYLHISSYIKQN